eukprot:g12232.t1
MKILQHFLALAILTISDRAQAYTLEITSCSSDGSGSDNEVTFFFCNGGSYCDAEIEVPLPAGTDIDVDGATIEVAVATGFMPTTMEIVKSTDSSDWWCIESVVWEGGENLLGEDARLALDGGTGYDNCIQGVTSDEISACLATWRFFNIDGAEDYEYDVQVQACAGTSSASVVAHFCSNTACDGEVGEEESVEFTMSSEAGGLTTTSFALPFNPLAVRLEEVDDTWCAEHFLFNRFVVAGGSLDTSDFAEEGGSIIFHNIQQHGEFQLLAPTPAPTPAPTLAPIVDEESEDDAVWLDAAWEVAVTVIGSVVVAAGAACGSFIWSRNRSHQQQTEASILWPCRPVTRNGPISLPGKSVGDSDTSEGEEQEPANEQEQEQEERPPSSTSV